MINRRPRVLTEEEETQINFLQKWKIKVQERRALQRTQSLEEIRFDDTEKDIKTGLGKTSIKKSKKRDIAQWASSLNNAKNLGHLKFT